ncbi:MAG TPA: alanine racemase, partial [Acetobacteraceae bacterium]
MPADAAGGVLEIDLGAIVANWRLLCRMHPSGPVAGVVKADGYGLGAAMVAPALHAAGCRHFFVALLDEALAIRDRVPDAMVAVLNGLPAGAEPDFLAAAITPVLGSLAEVDRWRAAAGRAGRVLPALLHVDTGMARLGLDARELAVLAQDHGRLAGIGLRYVMTHLVASEEPDNPLNRRQREAFAAACAVLPPAPRSLANSSGIFLGADWGSDLARPGAALYGINPVPGRPNPLRQVVRLSAQVLTVRDVPVGGTVGYNATWTARRPSRIATAAIGYADG